MKTKKEYELLFERFTRPLTKDEFRAATLAVTPEEAERSSSRFRPEDWVGKYNNREEWLWGQRRRIVHQREANKPSKVCSAQTHLRQGKYYRGHAFNCISGFTSSWKVYVDQLEPGVDFQLARKLLTGKRGFGGFEHFEERITAVGATLLEGDWEIVVYCSTTIEEYIHHVWKVTNHPTRCGATYNTASGEANTPHTLDQMEVNYGLRLGGWT